MRAYRNHNLNLPPEDRDPSCPPITPREFQKAILGAKAGKAPGNTGIPNQVLHLALGALQPILLPTMDFCLKHGIHPNNWKTSITVTLRKPGKDDYSKPKSYRPIALLDTIGKVMESIIATRISYWVECYCLLPMDHIGGRRMRGVLCTCLWSVSTASSAQGQQPKGQR